MDEEFDRLYELVVKAKADWQNTFDSLPDLICILDADSRIRRVNRAFSTQVQKPYESLIGVPCDDILGMFHAVPSSHLFDKVMRTRSPSHYDQDIEINGAVYSVSMYPYFDRSGDLQGAVHILRDITDRKRLKNKLIQSEKMAAIGALAAEIAHDINNPLDYISNYLYLLSDSLPQDGAHRDYLERIQTGIDNLAALTRDLLDLSRPQADTFLPVDIHETLESALELIEQRVKTTSVKIVKKFGCSNKQVMGSERMIREVFVNLIQNALDAMNDGGSICISTLCKGDLFTITIEDTGIGISPEDLSKIFEPFFTTKKNEKKRGTGLGLAICYNIIKQHNGDIAVSSKVNTGTAFSVMLPVISL